MLSKKTFLPFLPLCACVRSAPIPSHPSQLGGRTPAADSIARKATVMLISSADHASRPLRSFCTGTLVAHNLVVTAAHCLEDPPHADAALLLFATSDEPVNGRLQGPMRRIASWGWLDGQQTSFPNLDLG